jgi:hypothetical protein
MGKDGNQLQHCGTFACIGPWACPSVKPGGNLTQPVPAKARRQPGNQRRRLGGPFKTGTPSPEQGLWFVLGQAAPGGKKNSQIIGGTGIAAGGKIMEHGRSLAMTTGGRGAQRFVERRQVLCQRRNTPDKDKARKGCARPCHFPATMTSCR